MTAIPLSLLPDTAEVLPDGSLAIGGCRVLDVVEEFGTPLFIYDEAHLRARCREAVAAFGHGRAVYATKAFLCKAMARLAYDEGMLLDVASGGEMYVALSAGVPAERADVPRQQQERRRAARQRSPTACATSSSTASTSSIGSTRFTPRACPFPQCLARITPGVHAHTHEFIATGQDDSKFGFNLGNGDAQRAVDRMRRSASVELVGVHCHIGSNVFAASNFAKAAEVMATFAVPLDLPELVLGWRPRRRLRGR